VVRARDSNSSSNNRAMAMTLRVVEAAHHGALSHR
jgi:hypothetical protein